MSRPSIFDEAIIRTVARKLSPKVASWLGEGGVDVSEELFEAIDNALSWDGYRIARSLEDGAGWEPDEELVRVLERAFTEAHTARDELTRQWVVSEGIKPAHKVGDKVQYKKEATVYEVTKIDEQLARYVLFSEALGHVRSGPGTHGSYINFEDVTDLPPGDSQGV